MSCSTILPGKTVHRSQKKQQKKTNEQKCTGKWTLESSTEWCEQTSEAGCIILTQLISRSRAPSLYEQPLKRVQASFLLVGRTLDDPVTDGYYS